MDFYLSIGGSKAGPYSIFKVGDLLDSGEATADTLAWHRDLDGWLPIREVPALEAVRQRNLARESEIPPHPDSAPEHPHAQELGESPLPSLAPLDPAALNLPVQARPYIRFWARMFDYTLVNVFVFLVSDIALPQPAPNEGFSELMARYMEEMLKPEALLFARTLFAALLGWHLIEAVLIHLFGTTPGKALFRLKVKSLDGNLIPMLPSLARSFYVYVMGVGFYQFPFILIGMVFSFFRLKSTGECLWDQHLKIRVEGPPLGPGRILLAICVFFALLMLQSIKFS